MKRSHWMSVLRRMDWSFLFAVVMLLLLGVLFIFSASSRNAEEALSEMSRRQMVWALVGGACFLGVVLADYRRLDESAWWIYVGGLILLALVFVVGKAKYGATRWISFLGVQVQPSEFAKLGTLVLLASFLSHPSRDTSRWTSFVGALVLLGVPFAMIVQQPDLGTAMTLVPMTLAMLLAAGTPLRYLVGLAIAGLLALPVMWLLMADYQKDRILVFLDPSRDPLDAGWNTVQSAIAVGSGGLTGKGYLRGTQNILGFLPRTVAPTDFIFSVIAEETGFLGSLTLLLLFAVVAFGGMRAALGARDKFGRLLAVGVTVLVVFHVFVNMAMTIGLMPITGIPLPLVSYGGSFMVCTLAALGVVQSVYVRRVRR
jgi:rod shape determining protein RodA